MGECRRIFLLFADAAMVTLDHFKENIPPDALIIGPPLSVPPRDGGDCSDGSGYINHFPSVSSFALYLCRRFRLLRNERTLCLPLVDVFAKINLLLSQSNKKAYGSGDTEISDVLDIFRLIKESKSNHEAAAAETEKLVTTSSHAMIAKDYAASLREDNLVDQFDLVRILKKKLAEDETLLGYLSQFKTVFLTKHGFGGKKAADLELLKLLLLKGRVQKVVVETALDATGITHIHYEDLEDIDVYADEWSSSSAEPATVKYCQQLIQGYFRLLVNSRDEMALASIIAGPCGILDHEAFTVIKQQANKSRMPMFQTMVSYVQKLRLGGKSYAPTDSHPFFAYTKALVDFVSFVEKLQTQIEEKKDAGEALARISGILRGHIVKSASLRPASVEESFAMLEVLVQRVIGRGNLASADNTPMRDVGSGGSVVGRKVLKVLRDIADHFCTYSSVIDLHNLLGKIPAHNGTPIVASHAASLFRSPDLPEGKDGESLGERLGLEEVLQSKRASPKSFFKAQKFGCTYSWAPETSPIVQDSPLGLIIAVPVDDDVARTPAVKRATALGEHDDDKDESAVFKKAKVCIAVAVQQSKNLRKQAPKNLPKRSILKDIANMKTPAILQETPKICASSLANATMPVLKLAENPTRAALDKKKRQKEKVLLKGQTKMTAFLRM